MHTYRKRGILFVIIAAVFMLGWGIGVFAERYAREQAAFRADAICRSAAEEAHDAFQMYWATGEQAEYDRGMDCLTTLWETYPRATRNGTSYNDIFPILNITYGRMWVIEDYELSEDERELLLQGLSLLAEDHSDYMGARYLWQFNQIPLDTPDV